MLLAAHSIFVLYGSQWLLYITYCLMMSGTKYRITYEVRTYIFCYYIQYILYCEKRVDHFCYS